MKKVIRLKESDIARIVKRVLKEQNMGGEVDIEQSGDGTSTHVTWGDSKLVSNILNNLPYNTEFLMLHRCEFADFSNFDMSLYPEMIAISLSGTKNNFEKQNFESFESIDPKGLFVKKHDI